MRQKQLVWLFEGISASPAKLLCLQREDLSNGRSRYAQPEQPDDVDEEKRRPVLRCVSCRAMIARPTDRIAMNGQHEHVFANPHGYIYQIGCFAEAAGCALTGEASPYFSWFPGYAWQLAICGRCFTFLGWNFRSQESQFFGLILNKLILHA